MTYGWFSCDKISPTEFSSVYEVTDISIMDFEKAKGLKGCRYFVGYESKGGCSHFL